MFGTEKSMAYTETGGHDNFQWVLEENIDSAAVSFKI